MPEQEQAAKPVEYAIVVDGEELAEDWANDLSFREQRAFRDAIRELVGDPNADVDLEEMPLVDFIPALVYIVRRRKNPDYKLDDVLDSKPSDFLQQRDGEIPPTSAAKPAAKPKR